jgi:uncharacterized protein (TIGR02996 family)
MIHYEPDIAVVPCLGCNEPVTELDVVRSRRVVSSGIYWYPYHLWCIRDNPLPACSLLECAECGAGLDLEDVRAAVRWGATFYMRVHRRLLSATAPRGLVRDHPQNAVPRPPGLRLVSVPRPPAAPAPTGAFTGKDRDDERWVQSWFELVHDDCPDVDSWHDQLRAERTDDELRLVYADWLEQRGDLPRAGFVRLAVARRRAIGDAQRAHDRELRPLAKAFRGSWVRDVCYSESIANTQAGTSR